MTCAPGVSLTPGVTKTLLSSLWLSEERNHISIIHYFHYQVLVYFLALGRCGNQRF